LGAEEAVMLHRAWKLSEIKQVGVLKLSVKTPDRKTAHRAAQPAESVNTSGI
jgi:hypothetical protein